MKLTATVGVRASIPFQPLVKIYLGREIWNIVDVAAGIFLIGSVFYRQKDIQKEK